MIFFSEESIIFPGNRLITRYQNVKNIKNKSFETFFLEYDTMIAEATLRRLKYWQAWGPDEVVKFKKYSILHYRMSAW